LISRNALSASCRRVTAPPINEILICNSAKITPIIKKDDKAGTFTTGSKDLEAYQFHAKKEEEEEEEGVVVLYMSVFCAVAQNCSIINLAMDHILSPSKEAIFIPLVTTETADSIGLTLLLRPTMAEEIWRDVPGRTG
jgi:hypothetical protein